MTFKKIMKNKAMIAMGIFIVAFIASLPFISRAVSGTEMQTNELTDTSVLITGRILNPDNQSVKIGTVEQNNPQASYVYTNPFTLLDDASVSPIEGRTGNTTGYGNTSVGERTGKNNTTGYGNTSVGEKGVYNNTSAYGNTGVGEKGSAYNSVVYQTISGLAPNTTYCSVVVDASDPSNTPIYGSEICYTTLATGASYKNGELTSVVLDTQSMTDTSATIKFMVNPDGKALGLSLKYGVGKKDFTDSDYTKDTGEFFRTATATSNSLPATAEIKNLEKDTTYYYEVYNTDTKEVYHDNLFTTAASAGTVINQSSSNTTTTTTCVPGEYCLLAPLPGLSKINVQTTGIGGYLAIIFKIGIGLAGVLAVVMLVVGGIQYMSTDAFSEKADGKSRMMNAIIGLLLVLGAWVILNTLNPNLLIFNLDLQKVSITVDEANFADTEVEIQSNKGYSMNGASFQSPNPSAGIADFAAKLKSGYKIDLITVDTASKKATFSARNGASSATVSVDINIGKNGVAEIGKAKEGDGKTPKGETVINSDRRISNSTSNAVTSRNGKYNLGAAFINIGTNPDRGIGFHGKWNNSLGVTNGCIRMYNDDLIVLAPYMATGTKVLIK